MYPHERSLVKRLKDKPFALLGVNSDADREVLKQVLADKNLTWRSFWDGGSTQGPIATRWNVQGWPTVYVIDHKGIIRARDISGDSLDKLIDTLIGEIE